MSSSARTDSLATVEAWLAAPVERRLELIDGELHEKASPDYLHGRIQLDVAQQVRPWFHHRGGGGRPGGWWIASEVDLLLQGNGYRPDLVGWRRDRVPEVPPERPETVRPVTVRPDWVCEILSPGNASTDTVKKLRKYQQAGIPHYWIVDPARRTLTVHRWAPEGYLTVLAAEAGERVRAEPFEAIELEVSALLGEEVAD